MKGIDYSILPEPFSPMYKIHRYWGRKPWNILKEYINKYSPSKDEIFLDPFCGSGIALSEALKLNRRVIGIDLNPIGIFITKQLITPIDLLKFEHAFEEVVNSVSETFFDEYSTQCRKCGTPSQVIHYLWHREKLAKGVRLEDIKGDIERELIAVTYKCDKCGLQTDFPIKSDRNKADKPFVAPKNIRNKILEKSLPSEAEYYFDLFTPRNLFLLSVIYDEILKIEDLKIQEMMKLVFTSRLEHSSRLEMYKALDDDVRGPRMVRSKSWIAPKFHIQRSYPEKNPLINFCNSFQQVFLSKKDSNGSILKCNIVDTFDDLLSGRGNVLLVNDSVDWIDNLPGECVDYVIADPPFVKDIRYLELSQLWHIWLGTDVNYEKEINYSEKAHDEYTLRLTEAFKKIHRVLKKGKSLTVTYQTDDIRLWDTMIQSPLNAEFLATKIIHQPVKYSTGAKYRSLMKKGEHKLLLGYYFSTFKKDLDSNDRHNVNEISKKIIKAAFSIISKRQEPTPLIFLFLNLYEQMTADEARKYSTTDILKILESSNELCRSDEIHKNPLWQKWTITNDRFDSTKSLEMLVRNELEEILLYENQKSPAYYIQLIMNKFKGPYVVSSQRVYRLLNEISEIANGERVLIIDQSLVADRKREEIIKNLSALGRKYSFRSEVKAPNIVIWFKSSNPRIMFYITMTGRHPNGQAEIMSQKLKKQFPQFYRIIIRPQSLEKKFENMTTHWDYIWLEDLEKLLCEKRIVDRYFVKPEIQPTVLKKRVKATVVDKVKYEVDGKIGYFKLILSEPHIQKYAQPGQFINILCPVNGFKRKTGVFDTGTTYITHLREQRTVESAKPLLRRPISIHRIYYKDFDPKTLKRGRLIPEELSKILRSGKRDRFDIFVKVVGKGTEALSHVEPGSTLDIIGPLGKPIEVDRNLKEALLVAGGIGIAPLYALAEELRWTGRKVVLFLGTYDERDLKILGYDFHIDKAYAMKTYDARKLIKEFKDMGIDVYLCTIKESIPGIRQGKVTDTLMTYLSDNGHSLKDAGVFSCGPKEMLKAVAEIAHRFNLPHKVLLEERMGCGLGVCLSCVCPTKNDPVEFKRICMEGPTFDAETIAWDRY